MDVYFLIFECLVLCFVLFSCLFLLFVFMSIVTLRSNLMRAFDIILIKGYLLITPTHTIDIQSVTDGQRSINDL